MHNPSCFVVTLALLSACGPRQPGPAESEFGRFFFWQVENSKKSQEKCTDSPRWRDNLDVPRFQEGSFFVYQVAEDGRTAVAQQCNTFNPRTCTAIDAIQFEVNKHALRQIFTAEPQPFANTECTLGLQETWTMVDGGPVGSLTLGFDFSLLGSEEQCGPVDPLIILDSPNGRGIDGCHIELRIELAFAGARS